MVAMTVIVMMVVLAVVVRMVKKQTGSRYEVLLSRLDNVRLSIGAWRFAWNPTAQAPPNNSPVKQKP